MSLECCGSSDLRECFSKSLAVVQREKWVLFSSPSSASVIMFGDMSMLERGQAARWLRSTWIERLDRFAVCLFYKQRRLVKRSSRSSHTEWLDSFVLRLVPP